MASCWFRTLTCLPVIQVLHITVQDSAQNKPMDPQSQLSYHSRQAAGPLGPAPKMASGSYRPETAPGAASNPGVYGAAPLRQSMASSSMPEYSRAHRNYYPLGDDPYPGGALNVGTYTEEPVKYLGEPLPDLTRSNCCTVESTTTWANSVMNAICSVSGKPELCNQAILNILHQGLIHYLRTYGIGIKRDDEIPRKRARLSSPDLSYMEDARFRNSHNRDNTFHSWLNFASHLELIDAQKQITGRLERGITELQKFAQQSTPSDTPDGENPDSSPKSQLDDVVPPQASSHTTTKPPVKTFKALYFPANGKAPRIIHLTTVDVDCEDSEDASLSRLPDLRSPWGKEGWSKRQYFRITFSDPELADEDINSFYYIFISDDDKTLLPNRHFADGVHGDVFVMRQATYSSNDGGSPSFDDISESVLKMKHWRTMFKHAIEARKAV